LFEEALEPTKSGIENPTRKRHLSMTSPKRRTALHHARPPGRWRFSLKGLLTPPTGDPRVGERLSTRFPLSDGVDRNELGYGYASVRYEDLVPGLYHLQVAGKVSLELSHTRCLHVAIMVIWKRPNQVH
jgi:hypothetical protein